VNILVTGTRRSLATEEMTHIENVLLRAINTLPLEVRDLAPGNMLIHGAAPGVDSFCDELMDHWGWTICFHPADWDTHGKAAGPIRNQAMLDHHPDIDLVLAFPSPESRGTWDMVQRAVKRHLAVRVYPL